MSIKFKGLKEFERKLKDLPKAVEKKFRNKTVEVTVASGTSDREAEEALVKEGEKVAESLFQEAIGEVFKK